MGCNTNENIESDLGNKKNQDTVKCIKEEAYKNMDEEAIKLNADEKKKLDIFFSNFAEVFMESFTQDTISDKILIEFGIMHNYINNWNVIDIKSNYGYIETKYIEESVKKYFNKSIAKHQDAGDGKYLGDKYKIPMGDGEVRLCSEIQKLIDNKDGTYTAYVINYVREDYEDNEDVSVNYDDNHKIKALITKINYKGKSRYILLEYEEIDNLEFQKICKDKIHINSNTSAIQPEFNEVTEEDIKLGSAKADDFYIGEIINAYETGLIDAINNNDFSRVESYLIPNSNLYNAQKKLIPNLYEKGIKEKLIDFSFYDMEEIEDRIYDTEEIEDGIYKVYVTEKIQITRGEKNSITKEFNWIYTVIYNEKVLGLSDIEKWEK